MAKKECIEREAALIAIKNLYPSIPFTKLLIERWHKENKAYMECETAIEHLPAADVRPVVRGRWIRHYEQADTGEDIITYPCGWICSECGRWESEDEPFCNCGAMMEES